MGGLLRGQLYAICEDGLYTDRCCCAVRLNVKHMKQGPLANATQRSRGRKVSTEITRTLDLTRISFMAYPRPASFQQIPACVNEEPWADCPKTKDGTCTPTRSGAFRVANKPIIIHIGEDVVSALSCMALADGIVMGCSSFGQIAGLLSHGISMFSVRCDGDRTPAQYKAIPPMAIAERGEMWVPIEGSWHDPRLYSLELFDRVLDQHLGMRR